MKSYLNLLLTGATAITVMLASCSNEETPEAMPEGGNEISFLCSYAQDSRATDTAFESNDSIGVYVVAYGKTLQLGGNELNNELFRFDGTAWKSIRKTYWNVGLHDVFAYYPYTKSVNDTEQFEFSVQEDQSTHAGYTASDFLWASGTRVEASGDPVELQFAHRLSKVVVKLEKGENYEGEIPGECEIYIHSLVGNATIDLSTGDVEKDSSKGTTTIRAFKKSTGIYEAIVVPQNIESRRPLVEVIADGVSYLMEGKLSFKQGWSHTLVVTLSKNPTQTKIEIGGSIGGWN